MDRKEEIIKLQMDVINQMTQTNLRRIADDLWGVPTLQSGGTPAVKELQPATPSAPTPPPTPAQEKAGGAAQAETPQTQAEQEPPEDIGALRKELEDYIGLTVIKKEVQSLINLVTVQKLRKQNDLPVEDLSLHMVFSGNPGTGKTMIARLMSRIYRSLGILSKGQLVEVDRGGLVAGYVGQTAIKTGEAIMKALGGVLFVDEAYALTDHGENDYGQEAVDTLLKAMEDHRDDLVVIVAGYTELMERFVHSNPGLESRFNRFMRFPDYTVEEMLAIFDMRCNKSGYALSADARDLLKGLLALLSLDTNGFGNARGVRNLFERAVSAQADRLASLAQVTRDELMLLTSADIRIAAGQEEAAEKQVKAVTPEKQTECEAAAKPGIANPDTSPAAAPAQGGAGTSGKTSDAPKS
jgi:stage V sporulation protein K